MWHLTSCKTLVSLWFLKWNDFSLYLWINVANINSEIQQKKKKKKKFLIQFKDKRLTEILQAVRCHILWSYNYYISIY